jgi:beta-lactam-binding protein with PASTA domain
VNRGVEDRRRKTRRGVVLLVALLVALAVIAFFLVLALRSTPHVTVPGVSGLTVPAATQTLQNDNLSVGSTSSKTSATVTKGVVISSNPAVGAKVDKNSRVALVVSAGPTVTTVTVPKVEGQQFTAATEALQQVGLSYKTTYVSSTQPPGTVLKQNPAPNAQVKSTTVVKLTVSNLQSTTAVPSVVGFTQASAGSTLRGANLTVGSQTSACSQQVSANNVASQTPTAGTPVQPGTAVNLVISSGPCSATVPDVIQETQAAATTAISGTPGLTPSFTQVDCSSSGGTTGTVQSQSPSAGTVLNGPFPATVTMTVCQPPTTTTTPTTAPTTTTTSALKTTTPPTAPKSSPPPTAPKS